MNNLPCVTMAVRATMVTADTNRPAPSPNIQPAAAIATRYARLISGARSLLLRKAAANIDGMISSARERTPRTDMVRSEAPSRGPDLALVGKKRVYFLGKIGR